MEPADCLVARLSKPRVRGSSVTSFPDVVSRLVEPTRLSDVTEGRRLPMTDPNWLAGQLKSTRAHWRAVAYRMLGSLAEADDAVQEAWIKLSRADTHDVANLRAWLTTVVGRVCLNILRSRRTHPEAPLDAHIADPLVSPEQGI